MKLRRFFFFVLVLLLTGCVWYFYPQVTNKEAVSVPVEGIAITPLKGERQFVPRTLNMPSQSLVQSKRLVRPDDDLAGDFPTLNFRNVYQFHTSGEPILVTDPIYLADVYNSRDDIASILRARGVIVANFGGDTSGPIWWQFPYLLIPISAHYKDSPQPTANTQVLASEVGVDSGSFIFLPLKDDLPAALKKEIQKVIADKNGAKLKLPAGRWTVYYEQWEPKNQQPKTFFRNIALKWEKE